MANKHIHVLAEFIYSTDTEGPWQLFVYDADGFHSGAQYFQREPLKWPDDDITIAEARARVATAIDQAHEVRIVDVSDFLVFHSKDGRVLYGADFWTAITAIPKENQ